MLTELVSIPTETTSLDGLLYQPDARAPRGGVLLMHGNMGNFYTGPVRFLVPRLIELGFACLAFNRRGHDILVNSAGRGADGGAFQLASEGRADNAYAAAFFAERGYPRPIAIGHSNGGMLAGCFAADHPETSGLVLLSAHMGGTSVYERTCRTGLMAGEAAEEFATTARRMVSEGIGDRLLLMPGWWYAISAASLVDRMDHTPELLAQTPRISCPVLAVRGAWEDPGVYPMEEFARRVTGARAHVLPDSDHWYRGHETELVDLVGRWLDQTYD